MGRQESGKEILARNGFSRKTKTRDIFGTLPRTTRKKIMHEALTKLLDWGKNNNCEIANSVKFQYDQVKGYHAVSLQHDDPDSYSIQVSFPILFTPVRALEFFNTFPEKDTEIQSLCKLFLCHEKSIKNSSFWSPYINTLPSAGEIDTPFHWGAESRGSLNGSNLGKSLSSALQTVIEQWRAGIMLLSEDLRPSSFSQDYIEGTSLLEDPFADMNKLFPAEDCSWTSFPLYLWAHVIFTSRAFPYRIVDQDYANVSMLIPIMDLLNHNPHSQVDTFQTDSGLGLQQKASIPEAGEIPYNYGSKSNEELLLGYGFVIEDNTHDHVTFKVVPLDSRLEIPIDGLYHATLSDLIPRGLLDFCSYIDSGFKDDGLTLPMRLNGIVYLRTLVDARLAGVADVPTITNEKSRIYLEGQKKLMRLMLKELKRMEKHLLTEYRDSFMTYKAIVSHRPELSGGSRDEVIVEWLSGLNRDNCFMEAGWVCDAIEAAQDALGSDASRGSVVDCVLRSYGWMRSDDGPLVLVRAVKVD